MTDLLAARLQMAFSLGFHIIFACIGMVMPFFMAMAHWYWLKTRDKIYLGLTKSWMRGVAIFFAIGAVSGTTLAFELGLLFPKFMEHAGPIIGIAFAWEGIFFFMEAVALGFFVYGWNRINRWVHWFSGVIVGISGVFSGLFVICANGWMNYPTGFDWVDGKAENINSLTAMFNPVAIQQGIHMTIAAFAAVGFFVAGIHAVLILKEKNNALHKAAFKIALSFGTVAVLIQPISGDLISKQVAHLQPAKFAAMESLFKTTKGAPLLIGGIPLEDKEEVILGIHIPKALSYLAFGDFDAEVKGLDAFNPDERPPVFIVHLAFQVMVGIGFFLGGIGILAVFIANKNKDWLYNPIFLALVIIAAPMGFIALEAGWVVTEVGRQPWIIYKILKVSETVTPMPGLTVPLIIFTFIYIFLSVFSIWLLDRQIKAVRGFKT